MKHKVSQALLLLGSSYVTTAAQIKDVTTPFTFEQVQAQLNAFTDVVKNGTKVVNSVQPNAEPSNCTLAVGPTKPFSQAFQYAKH
jgi:hypothetical protein